MDQLLIELAKQIPALLVLVWLVSVFIKDRREGSKQSAAAFAQRDETIKAIAKESADANKACAVSMAESAEVIRQNTRALEKVAERVG